MILQPMVAFPLIISAGAIGITLIYASILDLRERRVPHKTWRPALVIAVPVAVWVYVLTFIADWRTAAAYLTLAAVFCGFFYLFQAMNLFGGADAYALIVITACIPFHPFETISGTSPLGFFPFTVLINAVLINIAAPLAILLKNLIEGNRAPLSCLFLGFPVSGEKIQNEFGFVMEDLEEGEDGRLVRRFIGFTESLRRIIRGERRIYTKDLRQHPDEYQKELTLYRKAGRVWISYGIPFIIPITAGFLTALFVGDIFFVIMKAIAGM